MRYFARFFENLQQDLKAFIYWCLVLIEILGEPGFKYSAMMPSVFANNEYVFNHRLLADGKGIFVQDKLQDKTINEQIAAARKIGAWRVLKGKEF